jgi:phytoene dehydrogenase-like protein
LLVALESPPDLPAGTETLRGPIHVAPDAAALDDATRAWRRAAVPERPPVMLRLVSAVDPSLAPDGAATLTVTLGAIPHTPFDGAWTREKRDGLRDVALAAVEAVLPGTTKRVLGSELIVPPDVEQMLGVSGGDLSGGELAPDQMLGLRPFADCRGTRTPVEGLYLAGPSSALGPLATCAAGVAAARAVMADFAAGRLR